MKPNKTSGTAKDNRQSVQKQPPKYPVYKENKAIEIPLSDKISLSGLITVLFVGGGFLLMALAAVLFTLWKVPDDISIIIGIILFFITLVGMIVLMAKDSAIDRRHNLQICTTPVKGRLVGYKRETRTHKGSSRTVYAPKYEIWINERYEIRTVNLFTKEKTWGEQLDLLANPNGSEMIPAKESDIPSV